MAMGNYPFPSTYVLNGRGTLPAWPVRVACESLNFPTTLSSNATLLEGLRNAVSVYYNYSRPDGEAPIQCFDLAAGVNKESQMVEDHWTYQFCTEMFMPSGSDGIRGELRILTCLLIRWGRETVGALLRQVTRIFIFQADVYRISQAYKRISCVAAGRQFFTDCVILATSFSPYSKDMFWPAPWDANAQSDACFRRFGVHPRRTWAVTMYGGLKALETASNIVFSNGLLDPWSGTGVLHNISDTVVALTLKEGAHHLDLMFSTSDDPEEVKEVRKTELAHIARWVMEAGEATEWANEKRKVKDVRKMLRTV